MVPSAGDLRGWQSGYVTFNAATCSHVSVHVGFGHAVRLMGTIYLHPSVLIIQVRWLLAWASETPCEASPMLRLQFAGSAPEIILFRCRRLDINTQQHVHIGSHGDGVKCTEWLESKGGGSCQYSLVQHKAPTAASKQYAFCSSSVVLYLLRGLQVDQH